MAYRKKEKEEVYISSFNSYKKICELKKPRSPKTILYCTNDFPDEWLIEVVEYRTKSGLVTYNPMIIAPNLKSHMNSFEKDGYIKIT